MSRHFLIDGYNLLYALPDMLSGSWQQKRESLLSLLLDLKPQGQNRATIVFDSREGFGSRATVGELEVVFTASETADDWIGRKVREIRNPRIVTVVTDDLGLRHLVRGTGAQWISTTDFMKSTGKKTQRPQGKQSLEAQDLITDEFKERWL